MHNQSIIAVQPFKQPITMSTDFCVEAILQRSCSSSSLSSKGTPHNSPQQEKAPLHPRPQPTLQPSPAKKNDSPPPSTSPVKKRGLKRKREDEENMEPPQPVKRGRTCFTKEQLDHLETVFSHTPYPDKLMKETIAEQLSLTQQKVHVSLACLLPHDVYMYLYIQYM